MRSVMANVGSIVSILSSTMNTESSMLKAAHCVMESLITQVNTIFDWDDDRKRALFESMKDQTPFKEALKKLDASV